MPPQVQQWRKLGGSCRLAEASLRSLEQSLPRCNGCEYLHYVWRMVKMLWGGNKHGNKHARISLLQSDRAAPWCGSGSVWVPGFSAFVEGTREHPWCQTHLERCHWGVLRVAGLLALEAKPLPASQPVVMFRLTEKGTKLSI